MKKLFYRLFGLDMKLLAKDNEINRLQNENAQISQDFAAYKDKTEKYIVQLKRDRKDYSERLEKALSTASAVGKPKHGKK